VRHPSGDIDRIGLDAPKRRDIIQVEQYTNDRPRGPYSRVHADDDEGLGGYHR